MLEVEKWSPEGDDVALRNSTFIRRFEVRPLAVLTINGTSPLQKDVGEFAQVPEKLSEIRAIKPQIGNVTNL